MDNLSSINQKYIQQTFNPSSIRPAAQNNPIPAVSPQPQVNLTQEPDVFVPSKKSHKKAIIGAGAIIAAGIGLYALVKSGRLSFTGREQNVGAPIAVPEEIIKVKDNVLASVSAIQEKAKAIITQSKEIKAKGETIQNTAQQEFNEVLEMIKKGAASNFEEAGNIRFIDKTNAKGELTGRIMEEFDGDKILRSAVFDKDNIGQIRSISKGVEKIPDGEKAAERFAFFDGKLYEYSTNVEETKTYSKAAEIFSFDSKTNALSTWKKDYFYSDKEYGYGEYIHFFEDGDFLWEKDYKRVKDVISGIETTTETTGESMSLKYDENNMVSSYEKGNKRISEYQNGKYQNTTKTDEEFEFRDGKISSWVKGFEIDKDNNQKRAYWLHFNQDGLHGSCAVNSTGIFEQEAYYEF